MPHILSDLNQGLPLTLVECRLVFNTLLIPHYKTDKELLLQYSLSDFDLLLNCESNLKSYGV